MPSFRRFGSMKFSRFHREAAATHTSALPTSHAGTSLGKNANTAHPFQSSPNGGVHPHIAEDLHASVRASGIEKKRSCPTACATSPMLVDRDRSFRNWSVYQIWNPRWVCSHGPASPHVLGHVPNTSKWSRHRSGARFRNVARSAETRSVEGLHQSQMIRQKQSFGGPLPLSPAPTPKQAANTRATCRGIVDKATASPAACLVNMCLMCSVVVTS